MEDDRFPSERMQGRIRRLIHMPRALMRRPVVSVLRLEGAIGPGGRFSNRLNDAAIARDTERAFQGRHLKAVALEINSPGGAPAQAAIIARRIRRLAQERNVKVLAFCEDVAASGGYMLACAADEIYADEYAIIGSIGVIHAGFGFQNALKKAGVERRVHTAGENKSFLDPFLPEKGGDVARLKTLQEAMHAQFIQHVQRARGARIAGAAESLFSGAFWTGREAVALGLADGIGHLDDVIRERFGEKVKLRRDQRRRTLADRIIGHGAQSLAERTVAAIEDHIVHAPWRGFR